ncbi:MAG: serine/threonine protein kinase, partial [Polyangiaceae bacterium]|nr:serine/threonine protein kinase [Polyangiaceae bacterium]
MNHPGNPTLEGRVLGGGRYRLLRILGRGGMGVVYEAVQVDLGRRVAIKLLGADVSPSALSRLGTEAQVMARLGNPHVAQISDFQHPPGEPAFLVMELLVGQSLAQLLHAEGVIAWERAARIGMQILDALGAAHAARVVHRDVKPANVFVVASAAVPDMVKVLDFGIAKVAGGDDAGPITRPGAALGTVTYMAPEQAFSEPVDGRADLYAVGVCLYQAVSGRRPFEGADARMILAAMAVGVPVPLEKYCPHVPVAFRSVVERALRRHPAERFQSAQEMIAALAACLGVGPHEAPITIPSASVAPHSSPRAVIPETTMDVPVSSAVPQMPQAYGAAPLYPTMTSQGLGPPSPSTALG